MPEQPIWLRGGRLIDPAQDYDGPGDVLLTPAGIVASGDPRVVAGLAARLATEGRPARPLDVPAGWVVAPGFIDLHAHLRAPGLELRETVQSGAAAAVAGGFTTICCMPNTRPSLDDRGALEWVQALAATAPARVLPIAAITKGQEGQTLTEMAELAAAGAVAFSDDGLPVRSGRLLRLALNYARPLGLPVVNHCEDPDLVGGGVMHEGAVATRLGLRGWPASGETVMLARDLELARVTGGRYHAAHLSVAGSVELVRRARDAGTRVTAEVTPHHLLLSHAWVAGEREGLLAAPDATHRALAFQGQDHSDRALVFQGQDHQPTGQDGQRYDTSAKVNPPLRTLADAEALLAGLADGTIDCIATDHAPHSTVEKDGTFDDAAFGISGLETALGLLLALVHAGERAHGPPLQMTTLIARLTRDPARVFDLAARIGQPVGTLAPGAAADVVVFDPDAAWIVAPEEFASQGRNTPLAGIGLRGRVQLTIAGGRVVFQREQA